MLRWWGSRGSGSGRSGRTGFGSRSGGRGRRRLARSRGGFGLRLWCVAVHLRLRGRRWFGRRRPLLHDRRRRRGGGRDRLRLSRRWRKWGSGCRRRRDMLLLLLRELSLRLLLALLDRLLLQEAEDIVEDEVAVGLLGKEEGLHKLPPVLTLV